MPTDITAGFSLISILLLNIVCKLVPISKAAIIGSLDDQGVDPCDCLPLILILKASAEAIAGPAFTAIAPLYELVTCIPNTTSGFSLKMPSFNINSAPPSSPSGGPSSAG